MALYPLEEFKSLVLSSNWTFLNEERPFRTLEKLDWNKDNLAQVLNGLHQDDFQKTVPKCKINNFVSEDFVIADQYEVHWDENEGARQPYQTNTTVSLSLKIAIMTNSEGQLAGIVTFHLSGSPY